MSHSGVYSRSELYILRNEWGFSLKAKIYRPSEAKSTCVCLLPLSTATALNQPTLLLSHLQCSRLTAATPWSPTTNNTLLHTFTAILIIWTLSPPFLRETRSTPPTLQMAELNWCKQTPRNNYFLFFFLCVCTPTRKNNTQICLMIIYITKNNDTVTGCAKILDLQYW